MCGRQVWLRAISLEVGGGGGGSAAAGRVLDRALAALPARKHIKVVTQAALAEFRAGSVERARSIMEGVLRNYPRRLDLWSVYLDQVPPAPPPPPPPPRRSPAPPEPAERYRLARHRTVDHAQAPGI